MQPLRYPSVDAPPGRGRLRGRQRLVAFLRVVPLLMLLMTVVTVVWTVMVMRATAASGLGLYLLLVAEIYLNWAAVLFTRDRFCPRTPLPSYKNGSSLQKVFFCTRCHTDTPYEMRHCPVCDTCVAQRDHHCFMMGTCITRHSMKHFMIGSIYGSVACFVSGVTFLSDCPMPRTVVYLAPVALGYYLSGVISFSKLVYAFVINMELCSGVTILGFTLHQIVFASMGRLPFCDHEDQARSAAHNLMRIFGGPWGFLNFLVPYSAFGYRKVKPPTGSKCV